MTRTEKQLRLHIKRIESTKAKVAVLRDELRSQISDLEDIFGSINESLDLTEDGLRQLNDGVDELSKYL